MNVGEQPSIAVPPDRIEAGVPSKHEEPAEPENVVVRAPKRRLRTMLRRWLGIEDAHLEALAYIDASVRDEREERLAFHDLFIGTLFVPFKVSTEATLHNIAWCLQCGSVQFVPHPQIQIVDVQTKDPEGKEVPGKGVLCGRCKHRSTGRIVTSS